jgi:SAM-dependent methyltransferase
MEFGLLDLPRDGENALLDVGAGFGDCLAFAQGLGWNAAGLEPSPFACNILKESGLPHIQGFVEDTPLNANTADVIRAAWVLEHLLNPGAVLDKFHIALRRGGRLLVTVPNDFTNIQAIAKRTLKKKDDWWVHHTHVNYFNLQSLNLLLRKHGFAVAQFYSTFPMEMFLLQGFDYTRDAKLGRKVHGWRKRFELAMHASEQGINDLVHLQQSFAACGMGRDIVVLGVKQ